MEKQRFLSSVSIHLCTSRSKASSVIKIDKNVRTSTTPAVLGKRNRMPAVAVLNVEAPMKPSKSSGMADQARNYRPQSQPTTEA